MPFWGVWEWALMWGASENLQGTKPRAGVGSAVVQSGYGDLSVTRLGMW